METKLTLRVGSGFSLVYEVGKSQPVGLDCIALLPPCALRTAGRRPIQSITQVARPRVNP